jgi:hypothetical protein
MWWRNVAVASVLSVILIFAFLAVLFLTADIGR